MARSMVSRACSISRSFGTTGRVRGASAFGCTASESPSFYSVHRPCFYFLCIFVFALFPLLFYSAAAISMPDPFVTLCVCVCLTVCVSACGEWLRSQGRPSATSALVGRHFGADCVAAGDAGLQRRGVEAVRVERRVVCGRSSSQRISIGKTTEETRKRIILITTHTPTGCSSPSPWTQSTLTDPACRCDDRLCPTISCHGSARPPRSAQSGLPLPDDGGLVFFLLLFAIFYRPASSIQYSQPCETVQSHCCLGLVLVLVSFTTASPPCLLQFGSSRLN